MLIPKILDDAQNNSIVGLDLKSIDRRYIVTRGTYEDASRRREQILNINSND